MVARKRRKSRKKKDPLGRRVGRLTTRLFIGITLLVIALYLIPYSPRLAGDRTTGTALSSTPGDITVRVLNGCGEKGLALKATHFLRELGFDVVEMRNADHFGYNETEVVALTENRLAADMVQQAFGTGRLVYDPDSTLLLDVSVTLGADCIGLPMSMERESN